MKTIKRNPIALNLPDIVPLLIAYGRSVVQAMSANPWFPAPAPELPGVTARLDELESAETMARTGTKGLAAARDLKRKAVEDDLGALKAHVQGIANQHPVEAAAIIASAGMSAKQFTRGQRAELDARMGPEPGVVLLRARSVRRRAAYAWQWSSDGGQTWTEAGTTTVANTSVSGLAVGTTYLFRFRATVKRTTGDWSQIITFTVH